MKKKFKLLSSWKNRQLADRACARAAFTIKAEGKAKTMSVKVEQTGSVGEPWEVWLYVK